MIPSTSNKEEYTVRHSVGGHEYALTLWPPRWTLTRFLQTCLTVLASPVWISLGALYITMQCISPRSVQSELCGWMLPRGMEFVDKAQGPKREVLLQHLSGRVLDVGAGGGSYFRYYTDKADSVVAVEPVETLHPYLRRAANMYLWRTKEEGEPQQPQPFTIVGDLADLDPARDRFDWVILGNVLCEVPCVADAVKRIDALLSPGGHVYFSEHVGCREGTWQRRIQDFINPIWRRGTMGCNCNRESLLHLEQLQQAQGGDRWQVVHWKLRNVSVALGPLVLGLAHKKRSHKEE